MKTDNTGGECNLPAGGRAQGVVPLTPICGSFPRARHGFTLIELLVVIAIMAILAGLIFPVTRAVNRVKMKARMNTELQEISSAIESYKDKLGHYPPDNTNSGYASPLYYELVGTVLTNFVGGQSYMTLDHSTWVKASDFPAAFGPLVTGFINCSRGPVGDEGGGAVNFLKAGFQAGQVGTVSTSVNPAIKVLVGSVPWPSALVGASPPAGLFAQGPTGEQPCWRYNCSNPHYNTTAFDLWVDVVIGGKINRFCNWSRDPIIMTSTATYP